MLSWRGFPGNSDCKASACNAGDLDSIPGLGRSPGEGNGHPLQYSCLENPMNRGAWRATVHGVTKGRTGLSHFTHKVPRQQYLMYIPELFYKSETHPPPPKEDVNYLILGAYSLQASWSLIGDTINQPENCAWADFIPCNAPSLTCPLKLLCLNSGKFRVWGA